MAAADPAVFRDARSADVPDLLRWLLLSAAIFVVDCFTGGANLALAYPVILGCYLLGRPRKLVLSLVAVLIGFTLFAYVVKPVPDFPRGLTRFLSERCLNRVLISSVLLVIASQARRVHALRDPAAFDSATWIGSASSDDLLFESVERSLLATIAVVLTVMVAVLDIVTGVRINASILLPLPLLVSGFSRTPRLASLMIPVAALLPFIDYLHGELMDPSALPAHALLNRSLTAAMAVLFAILLRHFVTRPSRA